MNPSNHLLAIDVGNTNIVFGLFEGKKLKKEWRFSTGKTDLPFPKIKIDQAMIASVVPSIDKNLAAAVRKRYNLIPIFVNAGNIPAIKLSFKNKKEIGADRLVNAFAAYTLYNGPAIVVDFGTATTFDCITAGGIYLGGAIAPGIAMARDALHQKTAKLPLAPIKAPKNAIGKTTVEAMQSGLVLGYAGMVEGMIARMPKAKVIATGGLSHLICKYTKVVDRIDTRLTLKGLQMIGELL